MVLLVVAASSDFHFPLLLLIPRLTEELVLCWCFDFTFK